METTRLDRFENGNYNPGTWMAKILWLSTSIFFFQSRIPWPSFWKRLLLNAFGAQVGKGVIIKPRVTIKYPWKLIVGDHCWIGENVWIDNLGQVTLGDHCCLSQGALLLCGNHNYKKATFDLMVSDIALEDGVWICARANVGPGVTCSSHSVLAMGSTATTDLEAWMIHQGNPASAKAKRNFDALC